MAPFGFSPFSGSEDPEEMKKNIEAAFAQLGITPAGFLDQFNSGAYCSRDCKEVCDRSWLPSRRK